MRKCELNQAKMCTLDIALYCRMFLRAKATILQKFFRLSVAAHRKYFIIKKVCIFFITVHLGQQQCKSHEIFFKKPLPSYLE